MQEDVQIVGLSILSGAHLALTDKTVDALRAAGASDVKLVVGGTVPRRDVARLEAAGAAAVYPTGTPLESLIESMRTLAGVRPISSMTAPERGADGRGPLTGIRVLEVGHILSGPFAGMLLADLGADVIKIEPVDGDLSRQVASPQVGGHNTYFASLNRNKRSVFIDLATHQGQAQLGALAATADALLVNLRAAAIRKLGLHYDAMRRFNPKIVCVALTGYGLDGPAAEWPSFDYVVQARAGVAAMTGEPGGPPILAGYSVVDNSAGIMAALGLVAKVLEGRGGQVDVSLFDSMLSQLNYRAAASLNGDAAPARSRLGAHAFYVPAQLFETSSGYLALFVTRDDHWRRLCEEIGHPEWADDPRFASLQARFENRAELLDVLEPVLMEGSAAEWERRLRPLGLAVGEVEELADALDSDLVDARWDGRLGRDRRRTAAHGREPDPFRRRHPRVSPATPPPRAHRRDTRNDAERRGGRGPQRANNAVSSPRAKVLKVRVNPTKAGVADSSRPSFAMPSAWTAKT